MVRLGILEKTSELYEWVFPTALNVQTERVAFLDCAVRLVVYLHFGSARDRCRETTECLLRMSIERYAMRLLAFIYEDII